MNRGIHAAIPPVHAQGSSTGLVSQSWYFKSGFTVANTCLLPSQHDVIMSICTITDQHVIQANSNALYDLCISMYTISQVYFCASHIAHCLIQLKIISLINQKLCNPTDQLWWCCYHLILGICFYRLLGFRFFTTLAYITSLSHMWLFSAYIITLPNSVSHIFVLKMWI